MKALSVNGFAFLMKITTFLFFPLLPLPYCLSQDLSSYNYISGPPFILTDGFQIGPFLVQDSEYFYTLRLNNKGYFDCKTGVSDAFIEMFDEKLRNLSSIPLNLSSADLCKHPTPKNIFLHDGKFLIFTEDIDLPSMTLRSFLFSFNLKGEMTDQPLMLGEVKKITKNSQVMENPEKTDYFKLMPFHEDTNLNLLYIQSFPPSDSPNLKLNIKLLNSRKELLFSKQLHMPFLTDYCEISNMLLYGKELVFIITLSPPFEDKLYKLVTYNFIKDEIAFYNFTLENKTIQSIGLNHTEKGNVYIYGFYSEKNKDEGTVGLFFFLFDETNQKVITQTTTNIMKSDFKTIRNKDLNNLVARDLFKRENGDVIFLSELSWPELMSFTDSENKYYFRTFYHSDHILVMCFTGDGSLKWQDWIPKKQFLPTEEYTGFSCIHGDSSIYLIFNDNHKNEGIYNPDQMRPVKNNPTMTITRINLNTGTFRKQFIDRSRNKEEKLVYRKAYTFPLNNRSVVMMEYHPSCLIRFTFSN